MQHEPRKRALMGSPGHLAVALLSLLTQTADVHAGDPAPASSFTLTSPLEKCLLRIVADDAYLRTGARYTVSVDGKQAWAAKKPYTIGLGAITDDGRVAGVAYRTDKHRSPDDGKRRQYIHVVILDSHGRELLNEELERKPHRALSIGVQEMTPIAYQVLVDAENDRVIVRGLDDKTPGEKFMDFWWVYELSTGESVRRFRPGTQRTKMFDPVRNMLQIALVPGTPLVLIHWELPGFGGRFTLVSPEGMQVWALDVDGDYASLGGPALSDTNRYFAANPAILESQTPEQFDLRFFTSNERVTYVANQVAEDAWEVREVSRFDYVTP